MPAGPLVNWWGGPGGVAPPAPPSDKFAPKYLVGNETSGDGTSASVAGFVYIQDPGDGSGIETALLQASGPGDVYVRPGTYVAAPAISVTVPTGVRVVGAGKELTLLTGINFILEPRASLSHLTSAVDSGDAVTLPFSAERCSLFEVRLELNGTATSGITMDSGLTWDAPYTESCRVERTEIEITVPTARGISCLGGVVSFYELSIEGGAVSVYTEENTSLVGSYGYFTGTSTSGIFCLANGGGSIRIADCSVESLGSAVALGGSLLGCRFENCILTGGSFGVDASMGALVDLVFSGCTITGDVGVSGMSPPCEQIHFSSCNIEGRVGAAFAGGAEDLHFEGSNLLGVTYALDVSLGVNVSGCSFRSEAVACRVTGTYAILCGCTFVSQGISSYALDIDAPGTVISGATVIGPGIDALASVIIRSAGCTISSMLVDVQNRACPAISVGGSENTLSAIRTLTDPGFPGVSFEVTSTNNILLGLSAVGPGSTLLAVVDLGTTNEIAHIIGT